MVVLNKIYTRTGDAGETGLASGARGISPWNFPEKTFSARTQRSSVKSRSIPLSLSAGEFRDASGPVAKMTG